MKLIKFTITAVAALMMTACSDSGYWEKADFSKPNYTFVTEAQSYSFEGNMPEYVVVYVNRSDAAAAANVPVTFTSSTPEITGASEVSFAAGQTQAEYKVNLGQNLVCGVNNKVSIKLDGDVEDYNIPAIALTIYREFSFSVIGEGQIDSPDAVEYTWPVTVERANEDAHVFRIPEAYYPMGGTAPMMITCSDDFTKATFKNFFPDFVISGYELYFTPAALGTIDGDNISFAINWNAVQGNSIAGSFGTYVDTITMPQGWK